VVDRHLGKSRRVVYRFEADDAESAPAAGGLRHPRKGPSKLVRQFAARREQTRAASQTAAHVVEVVAEPLLAARFNELQPRVLETRIEPAEPGSEQTHPAQLAQLLVSELPEVPGTDALHVVVLDLGVGGDGDEMIDLRLDLRPVIVRKILRVPEPGFVKKPKLQLAPGDARPVLHHGPGNEIKRIK